MHNNIWDTNFPAQQAFDHVFRYSVACTSADRPAGPELGMRTAAVGSHPLVAVRAKGTTRQEPGTSFTLLSLDDPRVRVAGLTVPASGSVLVRLQSFAEEAVECRFTPGFPVLSAAAADYLGSAGRRLEPDARGALVVTVPKLGTTAMLLTTGSGARTVQPQPASEFHV